MPSQATEAPIARGILEEILPATATRPTMVVLGVAGTSYRLHLRCAALPATPVGKRITGVIRCEARRVDRVGTGGRFVEPVFGRPRRICGTVLGAGPDAGTLLIDAGGASTPGAPMGLPVVCRVTDPRQKPGDFVPGQMVVFDVLDGASFEAA